MNDTFSFARVIITLHNPPAMCGITGFIDTQQKTDRDTLSRMNQTLSRRGPDSAGIRHTPDYGLAMRRLAIIDVVHGAQPMSNPEQNVTLVFNGEIYNYREIRANLNELGHSFKTDSDTEVILHAYLEWGEPFVEKLNGMFAIAIADENKRKLLLFRDRLGIKPLYIHKSSSCFVFGSEIKAILEHPGTPRTLSEQAINQYLNYRFIPSPLSIYKEITQIDPASVVAVSMDTGAIDSTHTYWEPSIGTPYTDYEEAVSEVRSALSGAVTRRMISDVPLGVFLSGGIDSGLITAIMAQNSDTPVETFTIRFEEESFNEAPFAALVAERYKTNHHEKTIMPENIIEIFHDILAAHDQPFGNAGALPYYFVCQETVKDVTVALSGLGADELFIGYERHLIHHYNALMRKLPRGLLIQLLELLPVSKNKRSIVRRLKQYVSSMGSSDEEHYQQLLSVIEQDAIEGPAGHKAIYQQALLSAAGNDFYQRAALTDLRTMLLDDYLTFADRVSMFHSLEVRVPFLDHTLIEVSMRVPSNWKKKGAKTKWILRDGLGELLPPALLNRPKHGFEIPIAEWIRGKLKKEFQHYLFDCNNKQYPSVSSDRIRQMYDSHISYRQDHSKELYTIFMLNYWLKHFT